MWSSFFLLAPKRCEWNPIANLEASLTPQMSEAFLQQTFILSSIEKIVLCIE
jgi:hypothetical protein